MKLGRYISQGSLAWVRFTIDLRGDELLRFRIVWPMNVYQVFHYVDHISVFSLYNVNVERGKHGEVSSVVFEDFWKTQTVHQARWLKITMRLIVRERKLWGNVQSPEKSHGKNNVVLALGIILFIKKKKNCCEENAPCPVILLPSLNKGFWVFNKIYCSN